MINNNLQILMAIHNVNIKDVHEATGLSRTTISNLIHGYSEGIKFDTLEKLCNYFNCNVEDIIILK